MTGRFITFEGGEGAGKSTQVSRLAQRLQDIGQSVVQTREPGGAPGAEAIRALLVTGSTKRWDSLTEALLHSAARHDHVEHTIRPALTKDRWVLCDRFFDSTMAYQGHAQDLGSEAIETLTALSVGELKPDLTLVFDLPVEVGLARARARGSDEDRYERMGVEFHERLRSAFKDIAANNPDRCVIVDATGSPDEVEAEIWSITSTKFVL